MRIAFIGQKGLPATGGGIEKHVEKLACHLVEMGHEVFVYVRNNYTAKDLHEYEKIKLIHIPCPVSKNFNTPVYAFLATLHALFRKYDILHYQDIGPASFSFLPKIFKRRTFLVSTLHTQNYLNEKWGWLAKKYLKFGEWSACKVCEQTISTSKILKNHALKKHQSRVIYIPNGAKIGHNPEKKALERWNLKEKKYLLCVEKNVANEQGLVRLIEAFKKIEDTNKLSNNFKLVIVGNGFDQKNSEKQLQKLKGNREKIIFTKNQNGAVLEQLFSHAYLFVRASEIREFSTSLLETMGYGVPALVSDTPENLEAVGGCGFSFHSKNQTEFEEKLAYLVNKPAEVERMGRLAKERIKKEYSWPSTTRKILRIYESGLKKQHNLTLKKLAIEKFYVQ